MSQRLRSTLLLACVFAAVADLCHNRLLSMKDDQRRGTCEYTRALHVLCISNSCAGFVLPVLGERMARMVSTVHDASAYIQV